MAVTGDSFFTIDGIAQPSMRDWGIAAGKLYAGDNNIRNPLISPIYGEFLHFPPTILISGTRDILLSDTVRVHQKLCEGIRAELHIYEAIGHGEYTNPESPESREAYAELKKFVDAHLRK